MSWSGTRLANCAVASINSFYGTIRPVSFGLVFMGMAVFSGASGMAADADKGPTILSPEGPGLLLPNMNSQRGRQLFVQKGCVACHSVNGVGGKFAPALDVSPGIPYVSPFEFVSRMLRGAEAMIELQKKDLGYKVDLTASELADITAFAHDRKEQKKFTAAEIIPSVLRWLQEFN